MQDFSGLVNSGVTYHNGTGPRLLITAFQPVRSYWKYNDQKSASTVWGLIKVSQNMYNSSSGQDTVSSIRDKAKRKCALLTWKISAADVGYLVVVI